MNFLLRLVALGAVAYKKVESLQKEKLKSLHVNI